MGECKKNKEIKSRKLVMYKGAMWTLTKLAHNNRQNRQPFLAPSCFLIAMKNGPLLYVIGPRRFLYQFTERCQAHMKFFSYTFFMLFYLLFRIGGNRRIDLEKDK